jgi:hypothetical protein
MRFAVVLMGFASVLAACGDDGVTPSPFAGLWQGHGRTLNITNTGRARERINSGCCDVVLLMEFRISERRGTVDAATALATVTRVRVVDRQWFTRARPAPRVGETGTIRVRDGAVYEGLTGDYYCSARAWQPQLCGA